MTTNDICCVCLRTDEILRELNDELADHYEEMCDYNSGVTGLICCSLCAQCLKSSFDFICMCRKANRILRGWRNTNSQKAPLQSLHKLLDPQIIKQFGVNMQARDESRCNKQMEDCIDDKIVIIEKVLENPNSEAEINRETQSDKKNPINGRTLNDDQFCNDDQSRNDYQFFKDDQFCNDNQSRNDYQFFNDDQFFKDDQLCNDQFCKDGQLLNDYQFCKDDLPSNNLFCNDGQSRNDYQFFKDDQICNDGQSRNGDQFLFDDQLLNDVQSIIDEQLRTNEKNVEKESDEQKSEKDIVIYINYEEMANVDDIPECSEHESEIEDKKERSEAQAHECETCGRPFKTKKGLNLHRHKTHGSKSDGDVGVKPLSKLLECSICKQTFEDIKQLKQHKRFSHRRRKKPNPTSLTSYKCQVCESSGVGLLWLCMHYKRAHPDVPYCPPVNDKHSHLCDQCGRSFEVKCKLEDHIRQHTGARPYQCDHCSKRFRTKVMLQSHIVWHAPPRLRCTECGKKYHCASGLYEHMRSHAGVRSYKCAICDSGFASGYRLREHVRGVHLRVRKQSTQGSRDTLDTLESLYQQYHRTVPNSVAKVKKSAK